jgi:predicted outer membrane protein
MNLQISPSDPLSRRRHIWTIALLASSLAAGNLAAESSTGSSSSTTSNRSSSAATGGSSRTTDAQNTTDPTRSADTSTTTLKRADRRFLTKAAESSQKEIAIARLAAERATQPDVRSFAQELVSSHQRMASELTQIAQRKGVPLDSMSQGGMASTGSSTTMEASRNAGIAKDHGAPRATGAAGTANTGASTGVSPNASTATSGSETSTGASTTAGLPSDMASDRDYRRLARASGEEFDREYVDLLVEQHERDVRMFEKAAQNAQDNDVRTFASNHLPALQTHLDRANSLMKSAAE